MKHFGFIVFWIFVSLSLEALSSTTGVGNGDDGSDLEHLEKITTGILDATRQKAIEQIEKLNSRGIPHLGNLHDELTKADMYLVQQNINVKEFDQKSNVGPEVSPDRRFVYARTFARPYSATRFFPASLLLSEQQLVRLHIHEALHRALPGHVRENESVVSEITLALTEPNASFDSAKTKVSSLVDRIPTPNLSTSIRGGSDDTGRSSAASIYSPETPVTEKLKNPSTLQYSFQTFAKKRDNLSGASPVLSMHRLDSYLHPFGHGAHAVGMGLSFSFLSLIDKSYMGPLQISARVLLATIRGFDVNAWAEVAMYTLSEGELKNLPVVRDTQTIGLSMRCEADWFYSENFISMTLPSKSEFQLGQVKYSQSFRPTFDASVSAGAKIKSTAWLGFRGDLLLSQGTEISDQADNFRVEPDRVRLVRLGPELGFRTENINFRVFGQQVIDGTPGKSLDDFANLMGHGSGQGYLGTSLGITF